MEEQAFAKYYIDPISLGAEDQAAPMPHLYKQMSTLRIQPEEGAYNPLRRTYTFINKNLDIITNPCEAYLYCRVQQVGTRTPQGVPLANTIGIPSNAGIIHGFSWDINDTTITSINDNLASTLYAVHSGVYAASTTQLDHIGWTKDKGFLTENVLKENGAIEIKIPLKSFVPALKDNKTMWGVKTSLKIIFPNDFDDITYRLDGTVNPAGTGFELTSVELRMPYVKLENQKQLQLWSQMYSNTINKYWLDVDQYFSQNINNNNNTENENFRVAVKGLNSRPRWLLLHAVDTTVDARNDAKHKPMGFGGDGTRASIAAITNEDNSIRFKKLRIKLNGIYIDGGDVKEFLNVNATAVADDPGAPAEQAWLNHQGYMESYEEYCRFFGQYYDDRSTVKSFNQWLAEQLYVFDLTNIDAESIFSNSGNALIVEVEFSTFRGTSVVGTTIKLIANIMYDKQLNITHSDNKATLTIS